MPVDDVGVKVVKVTARYEEEEEEELSSGAVFFGQPNIVLIFLIFF